MAPGHDCTVCHEFTAAGTVFSAAGLGDADVLVVIGRELVATNGAGNFFTRSTIVFPVVPELRRGSFVRRMPQPVSSGACSGCHGTGATARITSPDALAR
jgi:hypothetical protein